MAMKSCSTFWWAIDFWVAIYGHLSASGLVDHDSSCLSIQWHHSSLWQPSRNIQEMLFNRIAHNYVKMLFTAPVTEYRDKFLKVWLVCYYKTVVHLMNRCWLWSFLSSHSISGITVYDQRTNALNLFCFSAVPRPDGSSCVLYILHCISHILQAVWRWIQREPHSNNSWMDCWLVFFFMYCLQVALKNLWKCSKELSPWRKWEQRIRHLFCKIFPAPQLLSSHWNVVMSYDDVQV